MSKDSLDSTKKAATVDEIIDSRFEAVAAAFNDQFEKMYHDFNLTLDKQYRDIRRIEISFANTINILFGLLNDEKVKRSALETVLTKGGLNPEEVLQEYDEQKRILQESGEWQEHSLDNLFGQQIGEQPKETKDDSGLIKF
jgi:hypothetical protein